MTKKKVWIGLGVGLFVVLLVAAIAVTWVVNRYLTVSGLESQLSTALHREVRLTDVEFSLWSGVKLSGVEVSEYPSGSSGKMLSAESIALQPHWWPLVRGEVVIGSVVVQNPTLRLIRNNDGSWNVTRGFLAALAPGVSTGSTARLSAPVFSVTPAHAQARSGEETTSPVQLTVNRVRLLDGNIQFTDQLKHRDFDFSFQQIGVSNLNPNRGATLHIDGLSFGNTTVNGTVELNRQPLQVRMTEGQIQQLNLESIRPYVSPHLPAGTSLREGIVDSTVESAVYGDDRIQFQGKLAVRDFSGSFGAYNPVPLSQVRLTGTLQHQLTSGQTRLDLESMNLDGTEYAGSINLELNPPWSNPALQGSVKLQDLDIQKTLTTARAFAPRAIPVVGTVTGTVENTNLQLSNRVQNLKITGSIEISGVDVSHHQLPTPLHVRRGVFELGDSQLKIDASLDQFNGTLDLKGSVDRYRTPDQASLNLDVKGSSLDVADALETIRSTKMVELPDLKASGKLSSVEGTLEGGLTNLTYSASGRVKGVSLSSNQFPGNVEGISGEVGYDGEYISLDALEGRYQQRPFKLAGKLPLPFSERKNFELKADLDSFPVQAIASFVPPDQIPGGIKVRNGFITLRNFSVSGNLQSPRASGEVRVEEGAVQTAQLKQPVEAINSRIELRNNRGTVQSLSARAAGGQINGNGTFNLNDRSLDLRINSDPFAVRALSEQIAALPPFPDNWKPGGQLSVNANIENKLTDPVVRGTLRAPSLSIGKISGSDASTPFVFRDGLLALSDLKLNSFGGRLTGRSTLKLLGQTPSFDADVNVSSLQLASILTSLTSVGKESKGNLSGVLSFSGPLNNPYELDGTVRLGGEDLVLKGTKFSEGLSGAFDIQNRDGSSDAGKIVGLLLKRTDLGESLGLNEIFSPEVTSRFERADLDVNFLKGQGTIQTLELENDDLTINGSGNIHVRGNLNAQLRIHPKEKLLKKAKKDWLRNTLAQGLPPLAVSGTYYQPQFAFQQFSQQLASQLVQQQLSPESKPNEEKKKKESKKQQQKKAVEDLLRNLFD